jgi:CD2 antigen cytoplasmic tail-binding protein 2
MNRKRNAADAELDMASISEIAKEAAAQSKTRARATREMQGDGGDGKKHSIDSDEEDELKQEHEKVDILDEDDIEGQEDDTIGNDGEVKITPFNLKEEQEEGQFSKDGAFIWKKDKDIQDAWLDNVDWVKVKEVSSAEKISQEAKDEAEDEAEAAYSENATYRSMLKLLKPSESVAKAIRRLGGPGQQKILQQRQRKIAQKLKKGTKLSDEEQMFKNSRDEMAQLTGFADTILSRSGNMEIYEETYEKIAFHLKQIDDEKDKKATVIPEGVDDDDALDMFADGLDVYKERTVTTEEKPTEPAAESIDLDSEVSWEFRWENEESAEIHGPHSSTEMLKWQESGFFDKGVFVRKFGTKEFFDGKRIDFDLYT